MSQTFFNDVLGENRRLRELNTELTREIRELQKQLEVEKDVTELLTSKLRSSEAGLEADMQRLVEVEEMYRKLLIEHKRLQSQMRALKYSGTSVQDIHLSRAAGTINKYKSMYEVELAARKKAERALEKAHARIDVYEGSSGGSPAGAAGRGQAGGRGRRRKSAFSKEVNDAFVRTKPLFLPSPDKPDPGSPSAPRVKAKKAGARGEERDGEAP